MTRRRTLAACSLIIAIIFCSVNGCANLSAERNQNYSYSMSSMGDSDTGFISGMGIVDYDPRIYSPGDIIETPYGPLVVPPLPY